MNRLDDDGGGLMVNKRRERGRIVGVGETHARNERRERCPVVIVPRDRQRAHRAAVERMREGDELRSMCLAPRVPVATSKLQTRFNRFGSAVAEERSLEVRQRGQPRREFAL